MKRMILGDVAQYINGRAFKPEEWEDIGKPIIRIQNLTNSTEVCNRTTNTYDEKYLITEGDLLFAWSASLGAHIWHGEDGWLNQHIFKVIPYQFIDKMYLYYYLVHIVDQLYAKTHGSGMVHITLKPFKETPIMVPSLDKQREIVSVIEDMFAKLDGAKEKAQAVADGFEDRKAAILYKAFTGELTAEWRRKEGRSFCDWKELTVGDIADVKGGKRVPKGMSLTDVDTGHPYIKAGNLKQGTVIGEGMSYVPNEVLPYIQRYTVNAGDVYITNVGACIGDCGVIPPEYDGANLTENAVKLTNLKCVSEYLAWYLSSNKVQQDIKNLIASATLGKLSIERIRTIRLFLPIMEEQKQVVQIIIALFKREERVKEAAEQVISQIDTMKKAILARAFRGELGTNDPSEPPADISIS